jgi:hypothetical protein
MDQLQRFNSTARTSGLLPASDAKASYVSFSETAGSALGQALDGAGQERDERAAGRIGTPRAAIEVHRNAAARGSVLQQAQILPRCAEDDRHFVERHAALRFVENPADNLDRLTPFPWR